MHLNFFFFCSYRLALQLEENETLRTALKNALKEKKEGLQFYKDMLAQAKQEFQQAHRKHEQGTDEGSVLTNTDPWRTTLRGRSLCMLPCLLLTTHTCTYKTDDLFHESDQHCEDMRYDTCFTLCWRNSEKNRIIMRSCLFINGRNILRNYQGKSSGFFSLFGTQKWKQTFLPSFLTHIAH